MSKIKDDINNVIDKKINSKTYEITLYPFNSDGYESHIYRYNYDKRIVLNI